MHLRSVTIWLMLVGLGLCLGSAWAGVGAASFESGCVAFNNNDLVSATRYYGDAVTKEPDNAQFRLALGMALALQDRYDHAIAQYKRAMQIDPDNAIGYFLAFGAYQRKGDARGADSIWRHIRARFPSGPDQTFVLGKTAELMNASVAQYPESAVFNELLGTAYQLEGRLDDAEAAYEKAHKVAPMWWKPWFDLGQIAMRRGDLTQAEKLFLEARKNDANRPEISEQLVEVRTQLGEYVKAQGDAVRAAAGRGQDYLYMTSGDLAYAQGNYSAAIHNYKQFLEKVREEASSSTRPASASAMALGAGVASSDGLNVPRVRVTGDSAVVFSSHTLTPLEVATVYVRLAASLVARDQFEAAQECILLAEANDSAAFWESQGYWKALADKGRLADHVAELEQGLRGGHNAAAHLLLSQSYLVTGESQKALQNLIALSSMKPRDVRVIEETGLLANALSEHQTTVDILMPAISSGIGKGRLQRICADALNALGRKAEALSMYRAARRSDHRDLASQIAIPRMLAEAGLYDDAIAEYNEAITSLPRELSLRLGLASVYEAKGMKIQARRAYEDALSIAPNSSEAQEGIKRNSD